jgi:predicted RNase H-like HicB family nuclease
MSHYIAFIHADDAPGFGVSFPDLPGCISHGDTLDHAMAEAVQALALHAEGMLADGDPLPAPRSAEAIMEDPDLADWRAGATLAYVPLVRDLGTARRVNVSLDAGLLAAIDASARRRNMTRSAFLASAAQKELTGVSDR